MKRKKTKRISGKAGLPPGTVIHIGDIKCPTTKIIETKYNSREFSERTIDKVTSHDSNKNYSFWVKLVGLHDTEIIEEIGTIYKIHSLVLEDIVNTLQRPKFEEFNDFIFITLKLINSNSPLFTISSEQISFVFGQNFLISFQESENDIFTPIQSRINKNKGKVRKEGVDYLAYALLDTILDQYFSTLENLGLAVDSLEEELIITSSPDTLRKIHLLKNEMIILKKIMLPIRDLINQFERSESFLIKETTKKYLKDTRDHCLQLFETLDSYHERVTNLMDMYFSMMSHRMNEIMKFLAIITTLFIPPTLLAGIYGMNFSHIPGIKNPIGFYIALLLMTLSMVGMYINFKKRKWL